MSLLDDDVLIMGDALKNQPLTDEIAEALGFEKSKYKSHFKRATFTRDRLVMRVKRKFLWITRIEEIILNPGISRYFLPQYSSGIRFESDRYIAEYVKNGELKANAVIKTVKELDEFCTEFLRKSIL